MLRRSRMRRREDTLEDFMPHYSPQGHYVSKEGLHHWVQGATALETVEENQILDRVRQGMNRLSEHLREVFIMRDLQGMDSEEVATKLGISPGLVRQRLHRARLGLRGALVSYMPEGRAC
jgi:RNA polymerase sigma-70 factor (ECF subfamily)